jgi:hypothetical protein
MKAQKKEEARVLRNAGVSINEIARHLCVSKGSVSAWVRDISITEAQRAVLKANSDIKARSLSWQTTCRNRRLGYQQVGWDLAERLHDDAQFVGGCMLFWAEGTKCKNAARMTNTDDRLMHYWWTFLQKYFNVRLEDVTLYINCHLGNGYPMSEVEAHWLSVLSLPSTCLRKTIIVTKQSSVAKNRHPYGVCCLRVDNTELVQKIFGALRNIVGIVESRWVD